jgi:hypothetical protein
MDHEVTILIRQHALTRTGHRGFRWERPTTIREPESAWWQAEEEPVVPAAPVFGVTVAVVGESECRWGMGAVVARLAGLAAQDELVIVVGAERRYEPGGCSVVAGLRDHLPRHHVVGLYVAQPCAGLGRQDADLVERLIDDGSLPVVVTPAATMRDVAASLATSLRADRVVRVSRTIHGVELHPVWRRATQPALLA